MSKPNPERNFEVLWKTFNDQEAAAEPRAEVRPFVLVPVDQLPAGLVAVASAASSVSSSSAAACAFTVGSSSARLAGAQKTVGEQQRARTMSGDSPPGEA
jgi:hypothetical protein